MRSSSVLVDILGFEKGAQNEEKSTGRPVDAVRQSCIHCVERKLSEAKKDLTFK